MHHVVMFSGGVGSWAAASRVPRESGDRLTLLFTDTKIEDEDLYRFLPEAAANVGGELVVIADGRTPWEVFDDERFIGNTRADPCSKILKRNLARKWVEGNCDADDTRVYFGISWEESHRWPTIEERWKPWATDAPLMHPPHYMKHRLMQRLRDAGIEPPRLYGLGFPHNNCGGFCTKAGQAHFRLLLKTMPDRYVHHEEQEQRLREKLGDFAILRDRTQGVTKPMTLRDFRGRIERDEEDQLDMFEWGGCGCFVDG